ncbi:MAG: DUF3488 domain-containing protein [Myxococcales bacterium]|nr:DUF3488 domain-containing protein [Myxococcales bacterium]
MGAGRVGLFVVGFDLVGLLFGGGTATFVGALALLGVFLRPPRLSARAVIPIHIATLLALGGFTLAGVAQDGLAVLVGWLLVHRVWTGSGRNDARLVLLFGGLLLLLGCLRTESLTMAPVLIAQAFLLPAALMRIEVGQTLPIGLRSLATGAAVAGLAVGLFILLPRLNAGYLASASASGAANEVMLGDDTTSSRDDQAVVMHLRVRTRDGVPVPGPFYVRGRGLDHFDGTRWAATLPAQRPPSPADADTEAEVELEPALGSVAFAPFETLAIQGIGQLLHDGDGTFFHHEGARGTRYVARVRRGPGRAPSLDSQARAALSQLPDLDPRVVPLAQSIAPGETDPDRLAAELERYLSASYAYLATPPTPEGDALAAFLFERRTGHCEYFATALAVMLRARGVPARLGTGYWSGELDADGVSIVVRQANAHAWVEVPTPTGWRIYDASPVDGLPPVAPPGLSAMISRVQDRWSRWIVNYDLGDQSGGLESIGRGAAALAGRPPPQWAAGTGLIVTFTMLIGAYVLAALAQLASGLLVVRKRAGPSDALAKVAARARRRLGALGVRRADVPLGMLAAQIRPDLGEPLGRLAAAVYSGKYGGGDLKAALEAARRADQDLGRAVRKRRDHPFEGLD